MSRTKKQPYRGSRAIDASCRNHGSCPHCAAGRKHAAARRAPAPEKLVHGVSGPEADGGPAWIECDLCGDYWCTEHAAHAHDCHCPAIEEWFAIGFDPYRDPYPGDSEFP